MIILTADSAKACFSLQGGQPWVLSWSEEALDQVLWSHFAEGRRGGIPVLFPFAGRVWSGGELGCYRLLSGRDIQGMPLHGFASQSLWEVVFQTKNQLELELQASEETLEVYPWDFSLRVLWVLSPRSLRAEVRLQARGPVGRYEDPMPVALGFHPYLNPACASRVQFLGSGEMSSVTQKGDAVLDWSPYGDISNGIWRWSRDASTQEHAVSLGSKLRMRMDPSLFPFTVLWAGKPFEPQEFFCVEPWMALPDAPHREAHQGGARWLQPGESLRGWFFLESVP